jgi:serine/threonine protein kinase
MKDIIDGFLEIGENKYLHRDLKLANIFMNNGVAKIADFGFAKKSQYFRNNAAPHSKNKSITWEVLFTCHLRP